MSYLKDNGIKAVCFDIDGTLYPKSETNRILVKTSLFHLPFALKYLAMRYKIREEDGYGDFETGSPEAFKRREYEIMYPKKNKSFEYFLEKEKSVFHDKWERDFLTIKGFEGMREFLLELKKEVPIGLLSDFPIGSKLKALNIEGIADYVISSEDIGRLKPSLLPFRLLKEHFGLSYGEMLYVGDSERKDVMGAKNAGMKTLLISQDAKKRRESNADIALSSFDEMGKILLGS